MKNLLVIAQKVDENDDHRGVFVEWLQEFSKKFDEVSVITVALGQYKLPQNVRVYSLGKERGIPKFIQAMRFYWYLIQLTSKSDGIFAHASPIFVIASWPIATMYGKKIALWYTHKSVTPKLRLATRLADIIFTASRESFRLASSKVIVTGHGIDTDQFRPADTKTPSDRLRIISVGRIAPVKNYETLIEACKILLDRHIDFYVTIVGEPSLEKDKQYQKQIKHNITSLGLERFFDFIGKVNYRDLPLRYQANDIFVHLSKTGSLDKTLLEAMSCGINVLSSNDAARKFLSAEFLFNENDSKELADKIERISKTSPAGSLRQYVVENHNIHKLIDKIYQLMKNK